VQSVIGPVWPVRGSDGRYHAAYEVQLLNATTLTWNVDKVRIRAAGGRRAKVRAWSGARVKDVMLRLSDRKLTRRIGPGEGALLHLEFSKRRRAVIPRRLEHELVLRNAKPAGGGPPRVTEAGGRVTVVRRAPARLGPPLRGDRWVAADGCCTAPRHVWSTQPFGPHQHTAQRYAIDWERLDAQGRLWTGDETVLSNWPGYGSEVLAVADATVARAIDGLPDQVPGALPTNIAPAQADGNAVFLRLPDGRFVFYAHMIAGSLRVKPGDRVQRGQVLGLLGNSGNSSAPHLHLHVMDTNAIFAANGLPYVFDAFTITAKIASTEAFNRAEATGEPAQLGPVRAGPRQGELPLDQVIVTWP
jgi:hypothetical protein